MPGLFARAGESPEIDAKIREALRQAAETKQRPGGPRGGIPHGWTREAVQRSLTRANWKAQRVVNFLWRNGLVAEEIENLPEDDAAFAKSAMKTLEMLHRAEHVSAETRRKAARDLMDFCKQKPASKVDATVDSPEGFLDACLNAATGNMGRPRKAVPDDTATGST